jgi:hypothetical protein
VRVASAPRRSDRRPALKWLRWVRRFRKRPRQHVPVTRRLSRNVGIQRRGSTRFAFGLALILVATLAFSAIAASAMTPPAGWTTLHAARSPVTVQLPASWQIHVPNGKDVRLLVAERNANAWMGVIIGPNDESRGAFYARLYKLRRTEELARDPHASIHTRVVSLPAGRAFESIVVRNDQSSHQRIREVQLDFLRDGMQYEFEYFCVEKMSGVYVPVFGTSARSIRLTH